MLSGVVRSVSRTLSPIMFWIVPIRPTFAPSVFSSTVFSRYVTVVLPLVPVTPIMVMESAGWPYQLAAAIASAWRALPVRTYGTSICGFFSQITAAAPFLTAAGINLWPSAAKPGTATKSPPGWTWRESALTPLISSSGEAVHSITSIPFKSS